MYQKLTAEKNVQGVQLYIAIYDEDIGTNNGRGGDDEPDDLVDIVVINHNQTVGLQSQRQSVGTYVVINVDITVLCAQNFGGSDCTQGCVDGVSNFTCECIPGYSGPLCDEGI